MNTEPNLKRVLEELSEVPGPASLADKALIGAKSQRRNRTILSGVAAVMAAAVIALPFAFRSAAPDPMGIGAGPSQPAVKPSVNVQNGAGTCQSAPSIRSDLKEVSQENWPAYVRMTIERLPARTDFVMQSGTATVCASGAYAVVNLGHGREKGHITVSLEHVTAQTPVSCAGLGPATEEQAAQVPTTLLFCAENSGGIKLVYGIDDGHNSYRVYAIYADGRVVGMESLPVSSPGAKPEITAEQLRAVVTDPAMVALIS